MYLSMEVILIEKKVLENEVVRKRIESLIDWNS